MADKSKAQNRGKRRSDGNDSSSEIEDSQTSATSGTPSKGEVAWAKAEDRGTVAVNSEDSEFNMNVAGGVEANVYGNLATGSGQIRGIQKNVKVTMNIGVKELVSESQQRVGASNVRSMNTGRTVSESNKNNMLDITVRVLATRQTTRHRLPCSEKVGALWKLIECEHPGEQKFFNSDSNALKENLSFHENGVKSGDVIRVATEQTVDAGAPCKSRRTR